MLATQTATHDYLHLGPCEVVVANTPIDVGTILGSCVAVTMFDPRSRFASMCHAMLPSACSIPEETDLPSREGRYVDEAVRTMLDALQHFGADLGRLEVKLFGGADVISRTKAGKGSGIGEANVSMARTVIRQAGLSIQAEDVGGRRGRKLVFDTSSGGVRHRVLPVWKSAFPR